MAATDGAERDRQDTGDPDALVWFLPNSNPASADGWPFGRPHRPQAYHADPECQYIRAVDRDKLHHRPRRVAQDRGLGPCSRCVLDDVNQGNPDDGRKCPLCGETTELQLPKHLRLECSANAAGEGSDDG